jgi:hypothetical protein
MSPSKKKEKEIGVKHALISCMIVIAGIVERMMD